MPFVRSLMCALKASPSGDLLAAGIGAVARLRAGAKRSREEAGAEKTCQLDHIGSLVVSQGRAMPLVNLALTKEPLQRPIAHINSMTDAIQEHNYGELRDGHNLPPVRANLRAQKFQERLRV